MYAFVKYADGAAAIVPISLIKRFHPSDAKDFSATDVKQVFWADKDGSAANYYPGTVQYLAGSLDDLYEQLVTARKAIPRVFKDSDLDAMVSSAPPPKKTCQDIAKAAFKRTKTQDTEQGKKNMVKEVLRLQHSKVMKKKSRTRLPSSESDISDDDGAVVPEQYLLDAQEKIRVLKGEIKSLRKQLEEERALCHEVQRSLLAELARPKRVDVLDQEPFLRAQVPIQRAQASLQRSPCRPPQAQDTPLQPEAPLTPVCLSVMQHPVLHSPQEKATPEKSMEHPNEPVAEEQPSSCTEDKTAKPGTTNQAQLPPGDQEEIASVLNMTPPPEMIDLGHGVSTEKRKYLDVMKRPSDGRFCKDFARLLWSEEALLHRSVTGAPCKRYSKEGRLPKPAMTPEKKDALEGAFKVYIERTDPEGSEMWKKRLGAMNRHLASLLQGHQSARGRINKETQQDNAEMN
ncbi:uncharacterized protein LOC135387368 [Ornithodoros turicata]|uniref:uncharacterized protein LOC135387368 n=1 Tax=Ornithodoros turicata TaxID=34597 RepID=UPI00313889D7